MPIESQQDPATRSVAESARAPLRMRHGSSKMLESYLGDIEYLVRERLWGEAAPLALALPHICAALAHPAMQSSREQFLHWCESWVRPPLSDTTMSVPTPEQIYALANERGVAHEIESRPGVPTRPLRQLRLRRLARAAPMRRQVSAADVIDWDDEPAREACIALLEGVRRWYSECAARDPTVQTNLARLAVLR
ncbi:MAG TPA: hypothetical protein VMG11_15930 [Steroidobacteraceae bacterium]|nr:hypothetical protein [Steroidobacteraceae bacterium]